MAVAREILSEPRGLVVIRHTGDSAWAKCPGGRPVLQGCPRRHCSPKMLPSPHLPRLSLRNPNRAAAHTFPSLLSPASSPLASPHGPVPRTWECDKPCSLSLPSVATPDWPRPEGTRTLGDKNGSTVTGERDLGDAPMPPWLEGCPGLQRLEVASPADRPASLCAAAWPLWVPPGPPTWNCGSGPPRTLRSHLRAVLTPGPPSGRTGCLIK